MTTRSEKLDTIIQRLSGTRQLLAVDAIDGDAVEENLDLSLIELTELLHEAHEEGC